MLEYVKKSIMDILKDDAGPRERLQSPPRTNHPGVPAYTFRSTDENLAFYFFAGGLHRLSGIRTTRPGRGSGSPRTGASAGRTQCDESRDKQDRDPGESPGSLRQVEECRAVCSSSGNTPKSAGRMQKQGKRGIQAVRQQLLEPQEEITTLDPAVSSRLAASFRPSGRTPAYRPDWSREERGFRTLVRRTSARICPRSCR